MKTTMVMAFPTAMISDGTDPLDPDTDGDGSDDGEEGEPRHRSTRPRHRW